MPPGGPRLSTTPSPPGMATRRAHSPQAPRSTAGLPQPRSPLLARLAPAMAGAAQALPVRPAPEQLLVTSMRHDVIDQLSRCRPAFLLAVHTQRMLTQPGRSGLLPLVPIATLAAAHPAAAPATAVCHGDAVILLRSQAGLEGGEAWHWKERRIAPPTDAGEASSPDGLGEDNSCGLREPSCRPVLRPPAVNSMNASAAGSCGP